MNMKSKKPPARGIWPFSLIVLYLTRFCINTSRFYLNPLQKIISIPFVNRLGFYQTGASIHLSRSIKYWLKRQPNQFERLPAVPLIDEDVKVLKLADLRLLQYSMDEKPNFCFAVVALLSWGKTGTKQLMGAMRQWARWRHRSGEAEPSIRGRRDCRQMKLLSVTGKRSFSTRWPRRRI